MTAYLTKTKNGYTLRITERPCNGAEFYNAEAIVVANKREARAICAARGAKPHNF